jgi:dienelactone hydrolase
VTIRPLELYSDEGLPIRCDVRVPAGDGPFPVVVVLPGFKGFKDWGMFPPACERLADAGLATVCVNVSRNGIGDRPTELTELALFAGNTPGRERDDVRIVLDGVAEGRAGEELDSDRIGLLGHSRGGGVAVLVAAQDDRVKALVTWAAVATFDRWTRRAKQEWRERGRLDVPNARTGQILWLDRAVLEDFEARSAEYDVEAAARRVRVPWHVVHGAVDEAVPSGEAGKLVAAAGAREKRLSVVPRTGHTFGAVHPWAGPTPAWERVMALTSDWFVRHLKGAS